MKSRVLLLALSVCAPLALAACGGNGDANSSAPAAAPVAAVPAPAGKDWTQVVSKTAEGYVMGNPNAPSSWSNMARACARPAAPSRSRGSSR